MTDFTADDILNKGQRPAGKGNTTRPSGQPVPSENTSVTAGQQGPVALNDIHLIEKLAHFNRERVPERTPHAKGCLLYTSPSPRDQRGSRMPSSA